MAEMGGRGCDERCGCPSPCPVGSGCKCGKASTAEHKQCSCGDHCGCNPCTCSDAPEIKGTGKAFCKCGAACNCPTCAAA